MCILVVYIVAYMWYSLCLVRIFNMCALQCYSIHVLCTLTTYAHITTLRMQVRGNKVSWTLGAILFEINTLPWRLDEVGRLLLACVYMQHIMYVRVTYLHYLCVSHIVVCFTHVYFNQLSYFLSMCICVCQSLTAKSWTDHIALLLLGQ